MQPCGHVKLRLMSEKKCCSYDSARNIFSACISRLYDITRWIYQAVQMSVAIEIVVLGISKQLGAGTQFEKI